jgi:succinate dehydrogenase/fumarate reductase flavoprotein subunit
MMGRLFTDVLVLGAGAAGIRPAITSCEKDVQVVVVAAD